MIKKSIYSTAFNIEGKGFDPKDALDNWFQYADEVSISVNKSEDNTLKVISDYANLKGYNLLIEETKFDYNDPFFYGKLENSALQRCTSEILIQQNLDERFGGDKDALEQLSAQLLNLPQFASFFVPVINLYNSYEEYFDFGQKWYIHKSGYKRGAVNFGVKPSGLPDYNKTSTDELVDEDHNLVPHYPLINHFLKNEPVRSEQDFIEYCKSGMPFVYHLGYVDLNERVQRNGFWKSYWEKATGGDENTHSLDVEDLKNRGRKKHGIQLWVS